MPVAGSDIYERSLEAMNDLVGRIARAERMSGMKEGGSLKNMRDQYRNVSAPGGKGHAEAHEILMRFVRAAQGPVEHHGPPVARAARRRLQDAVQALHLRQGRPHPRAEAARCRPATPAPLRRGLPAPDDLRAGRRAHHQEAAPHLARGTGGSDGRIG